MHNAPNSSHPSDANFKLRFMQCNAKICRECFFINAPFLGLITLVERPVPFCAHARRHHSFPFVVFIFNGEE